MSTEINGNLYNHDQKVRYFESINEYQQKIKFASLVFRKTNLYECEFNKDVYDFSKIEIEEMYKRLGVSSFNTLYLYNYHLSWYTCWAINQGLVKDSQNHFLEFETQELNDLLNKAAVNMMILTREQIIECTENLLNPRDQYMVLSVFEFGKRNRYKDAANASINDIDFTKKLLYTKTGRSIHISEKLIDYAVDAHDANFYVTVGKGGAERRLPLIDNGTIIKMTNMTLVYDNDACQGDRFYNSVRKILLKSDYPYVNTNTLVASGQVDMIKRRALYYNMGAEEYLFKHRCEVEDQYDTKIIVKTFMEKYRDFL